MSSSKRKRTDDVLPSTSKNARKNTNYYQPLQVLIDDNLTADDNIDDSTIKTPKIVIPPITIIKQDMDKIQKMCNDLKIINYSIRKISIGHKLFCDSQTDHYEAVKYLKDKDVEYFSYTPKNNRPYKVVLSGLDKTDPIQLKNELNKIGLQCIDVKPVFRKISNNREIILYIIYFKKGVITIKELREKYKSINYIRVKWSYQTKQPNKLTQCYNCQMFGHGSNNCNVKTFCSKCAGPHKTFDCKVDFIKCANCHDEHKSTDISCRSRNAYIGLRQRYANGNRPIRYHQQNNTQRQTTFTQQNIISKQSSSANMSYANVLSNDDTSNNLLSIDQLKTLTFDLINDLKKCKSKIEQLEVITSLAFKFLS